MSGEKLGTKSAAGGPKPAIDADLIRQLAGLLEETGLSEIEWCRGAVRVRVARRSNSAQAAAASLPPAPAPSAVTDMHGHPGAVRSPMVGTSYRSPEPGAAPFVQVGDPVREGQTVLIIEAMKTMNPIPAPKTGKVAQILVENQQPVEFDQVLMLIE
jgi:acetyl-CoA carboxylase biotin carboxyl carrier protein